MNIKLLTLGMMLVTMTPRILPFYMFDAEKLPVKVKTFLSFIPFAVLGALILPGGLTGVSGSVLVSTLCLFIAGVLAWTRGGIIIPIMASVGGAVIMSLLGMV